MQLAGWRLAYRNLLPASLLGPQLEQDKQAFWAQRFAQQTENQLLAVAGEGGNCLGVVCAFRAAPVEGGCYIEHIYVAPGALRRGLGRKLMSCAARWCASAYPDASLALSVVEQNLPAVAFYLRLGGLAEPAAAWHPSTEVCLPSLRFSWPDLDRLFGDEASSMTHTSA
ncbi:MAG: GNAT family N-acetyltransferase [Burkholderiaceae bacterium]|nr:GNAT family N-acetyltransferase [Burkholderiaceae bacterium]